MANDAARNHRARGDTVDLNTIDDQPVIHGDAVEVMRNLPSAGFDALVTDPPYCSGGTVAADRTTRTAADKYVSTDSRIGHELPDFAGDDRDQRAFTLWCSLWLSEALRVVRPGGTALVFTDWRQLPALSDALQIAGWRWRGVIVWSKTNPRPQPGFANQAEYVLWASHGKPGHRPPFLPGVYQQATPRGKARRHLTAKPLELMRALIKGCPADGRVLDPFCGSGTTGVAAYAEGRRFLGVEGSPAYATTANQRLNDCIPAHRRPRAS